LEYTAYFENTYLNTPFKFKDIISVRPLQACYRVLQNGSLVLARRTSEHTQTQFMDHPQRLDRVKWIVMFVSHHPTARRFAQHDMELEL